MPRRLLNTEWQLRRLPVVMALGAAMALACFVMVLLVWLNGNSVSNQEAQDFQRAIADNCDRENSTRAAVRRILTLAEDSTLSNPRMTAQDRRDTLTFYVSALKLVPLIDCGQLTAAN